MTKEVWKMKNISFNAIKKNTKLFDFDNAVGEEEEEEEVWKPRKSFNFSFLFPYFSDIVRKLTA